MPSKTPEQQADEWVKKALAGDTDGVPAAVVDVVTANLRLMAALSEYCGHATRSHDAYARLSGLLRKALAMEAKAAGHATRN